MAGLAFLGCFILFFMLADTRSRLKRAEATLSEAAKRIGALQRHTGLTTPPAPLSPWAVAAQAHAGSPVPVQAEPRPRPEPAPEPDVLRAAALAISPDRNDHVVSEPIEPHAPEESEAAEPETFETESEAAEVARLEVDEPETIEACAATPENAIEDREEQPVIVEPVEEFETAAPEVAESAEIGVRPPARPPGPPRSLGSRMEELFGKKLPIWAGGITLAIAGVLIVKYAIDQGIFGRIFTHGVQIASGLMFGTALIAGAEFAWRNDDKVHDVRVPQSLSGAGIATLYASVLVAVNAYELISPLTGFIGLAAITAAALGLSLRFGAPSALLGLAGGLAAPAMVGSLAPNIPLLAVYLGLTIAGLAGVSRMQRWPWLALAALVGGAGWSLWMILASNALDAMASISIGGFVLLLAIALPMLALSGPRAAFLRSISAIVGAGQLALLVAYGGFIPLHWGLFALLAAAGQWLAWRDTNFGIVPSIGLALSGLLLALWPEPTAYWFMLIGLSLAAIHALPLLARLWQGPPGLQRTFELCGLALAAPVLTKWHFWHGGDETLALVAIGAALLPEIAIATGWKHNDRFDDRRFAVLTTSAATLLALAIVLVLPEWLAPLGIAAVAAAMLFFGKAARDPRIESITAGFALAALPAFVLTMSGPQELQNLLEGAPSAIDPQALLRGAGLSVLFALFAWQAIGRELRFVSLAIAGAFAYATLAQAAPGWSLPLAMGVVASVLFAIAQRRGLPHVEHLSALFAALALALLALTGPDIVAQWSRLLSSDAAVSGAALLRWGGLAGLMVLFAWRGMSEPLRLSAHGAAALLAYGLLAQFIPGWSLPLAACAIAGALAWIASRGRTPGVRGLAVQAAVAALPVLIFSAEDTIAEWSRLWGSDASVPIVSSLRWGGVALLAVLFAARSQSTRLRRGASIAAALLGYGAVAQLIAGDWLPLVPAICGAILLLATIHFERERLYSAAATFAALSLAWAAIPLVLWSVAAARSLGGVPMILDPANFTPGRALKQLLSPALLFGAALWRIRSALGEWVRLTGMGICAVIAGIALHWLYRLGFAAAFGGEFVQTGLAQRLVWEGLLIGGGWLALLRQRERLAWGLLCAGVAHTLWYTLLLHNPLWSAQAVGSVPVANLLAPMFALAPLGIALLCRKWPDRPAIVGKALQPLYMLLVCGFAWASLRQIFHGTLLVTPGVLPAENILRSILFLALAIGFLLWGIRAAKHDWRIASLVLMLGAVGKVFLFDASGLEGLFRIGSFVALGFSLIGIGWLYSRQLAQGPAESLAQGADS